MRVQRENLSVVFGKIPPEIVAKEITQLTKTQKNIEVSHKSIPESLFINLSSSLKSNYSKDERKEQHKILLKDMEGSKLSCSNKNSVFNAVYVFAESALTTNRYVPICKYDCLLKWNDISHDLGQDLFTTAYLAFKDVLTASETNFFGWKPIIDTTNERLYKMLNEGIAENHYHLYGSSQCFPINWIVTMNKPLYCIDKLKEMHQLETNLTSRTSYSVDYNMAPWESKLIWAAYIRCYLFEKFNLNKISYTEEDNLDKVDEDEQNATKSDTIEEIFFGEKTEKKNSWELLSQTNIINVLNENALTDNKKLERRINSLKHIYGMKFKYTKDVCFDYALLNTLQEDNFNCNRILVGERKLLYDCFCEFAKGNLSDFDCNLLYLYLLIKIEFRHELVQSNKEYGFKNFADFQSRKLLFVKDGDEYFDESLRLALNMPLKTQNIVSFEVRITPEKKESSLKSRILSIDSTFLSSKDDLSVWPPQKKGFNLDQRKFYYVIHYPKNNKWDDKKHNKHSPLCRNYACRKMNKEYTEVLVNELKAESYLREAIRGIDACSNEIGCRPETFATDFRYLRQVIPNNRRSMFKKNEKPVQLKLTYHVGEDFLNLTDGLRAIDEAMLFLNMQRCDRLGHALALGIDADKYYELKGNRIIMPKQDALDDDVWLLYKANEYNIQIDKSLEQKMIYRIQDRIRYIYGNGLRRNNISADPFVYYKSWMLRGDHPALYISYGYDESKVKSFGYESFFVNKDIPPQSIREDTDVVKLYSMYHYDEDAKTKGHETEILKITPDYIKLVKQIQKKMQFLIAEKGIAIECNPSSNYLIGTFRRYDAHPITIFNNTFLEHRQDKLLDCAQLSVSINTDDQGVFDTSLTNEYALLALALEKKHDSDGKRLYSASNIYQYLDWVRKMGIEQTFGY